MRLKNGEKNMKWNCRSFIKRKKNEESKRKEQDVFRKSPNGRSTDIMDKNNTYISSGGRKFKIIKNPRGRWIVQSGDRKERVSIEWQL